MRLQQFLRLYLSVGSQDGLKSHLQSPVLFGVDRSTVIFCHEKLGIGVCVYSEHKSLLYLQCSSPFRESKTCYLWTCYTQTSFGQTRYWFEVSLVLGLVLATRFAVQGLEKVIPIFFLYFRDFFYILRNCEKDFLKYFYCKKTRNNTL